MEIPSGIITYRNHREVFLATLEKAGSPVLPTAVQYELESLYREKEHGQGFCDLSFLVLKDNILQSSVFYHRYGTSSGFNGSGAEIHLLSRDKHVLKVILDTLHDSAAEQGLDSIRIADTNSRENLSALGMECYNRNGCPHYALRAQIDLCRSEEKIHADLRKSYKSLINKGRLEIDFKYITKNDPEESLYRDFEDFHLKTAGKKTRPAESWDVHLDMIKAGTAELLMGYMPPYGLVSSALFVDFGPATTYAVAVYDRDLFDRPLAHSNVYEGLLRAKKRGQTSFNLGIMPLPDKATEKELNIAKFKKGFVPYLTGLIEWTIPVSGPLKD